MMVGFTLPRKHLPRMRAHGGHRERRAELSSALLASLSRRLRTSSTAIPTAVSNLERPRCRKSSGGSRPVAATPIG